MKFDILQGLRGVAAALVVGFHAMGEALRLYPDASGLLFALFSAGGIGVDLFFVVSGFIIAMTADGAAGLGAGLAYLRKRIVRIVPLYWVFTLLLALSMLTDFPLLTASVPVTPDWLAASLLFAPSTLADRFTPIVFIGWTLNYEMLFYLLVFVAILLGRAALAPALILALVALGLAAPGGERATWYNFVTNPIMIEFVLGYAVFLVHKTACVGRGVSLAIIAAGTILFLASYIVLPEVSATMRPLVNGPLLAIQILGIVTFETASPRFPVPRWITRSGDASYSIYLLQAVTLPIATPVLVGLGLAPLGPDFVAASIVAATVALGILVHDRIELPLMSLARAVIPAPAVAARGVT